MIDYIKKNHVSKLALLLGIAGISLVFTAYSENISSYALAALRLCVFSVIPSIFPFMVLSSIASKTAAHLTEVGTAKTSVVLSVFLGALCGFPVGAATVAAMYKNGAFGKGFAEHLCSLCNNAGPAFVIDVIGRSFWGNNKIGIMFYVCQLLSAAVIFGVWYILFYNRRKDTCASDESHLESEQQYPRNTYSANAVERYARIFCTSVSDSAISVIQVCGYIVFFKVVCDTVRLFLPRDPISDYVFTLISVILEFTTGANSATELGGSLGIALCGFAISFSGLSVIAQSTGLLSKAGLSSIPLLIMKLLSGILSAFICCAIHTYFDLSETVSAVYIKSGADIMPIISAAILGTAFFIHIILSFYRRYTNQ